MNRKIVHVLDWSKIIQATSAKGTYRGKGDDDRTVNKGILFEDLIEKLIIAMFPNEVWRRTAESHDGKRDFVYPAETYLEEQKWAECKNYNSNLSLNIIAPTLIMGAIENIECIFFFSYSPLNNNAIEGLLRYSKTKKITVKIFDGNLLESLICRYHTTNSIAEFFPNTDFEKAYEMLQEKRLRVVKTVRDLNGNIIPSTHLFELGELFYIRTVIQNLTWEPIDCDLTLQISDSSRLWTEASGQSLSIPFTGLEEYSILCETLSAGSVNCTVKIIPKNRGKKGGKKTNQKIEIIDEPYLAWSGENALLARELCLAHLSGTSASPLVIVGGSGTGKSTLMEILLREKRVWERYRIIKIDSNLSRTNGVQNLFSQALGVQSRDETPQEQREDNENALALLVNSYAESADMIAKAIMSFYNSVQPYLFVIDDSQKLTRAYITLLQELDDLAKKDRKPIFFLLTLNDDCTTLEELFARLNWDQSYLNRKCEIIELKKFKKSDILAYIKTRYGLTDIDGYFEGVETEICPLELHSFCVGLKKSRVIAQVPNSKAYQIIDPFKFHDGVKHILYANISIQRICDTLGKNDIPAYILKYLYITDKVSPKMMRRYSSILQELIDQGILKERDGGIVFYHNKIREVVGRTLTFYEEDYADIFADYDTSHSSKAICALEQFDRIRGGASFLKRFFLSDGKIEQVTQRYAICRLVFDRLDKLSDIGLMPVALRFVRANYAALNEEHGHAAFFLFLKYIADSALTFDWDTDEESVEIMAYFIKKYFDRALSTYNYKECLAYFQKYEKLFAGLKHISSKRCAFWLSHYANRAAIALDRTSVPLVAEPADVSKLYNQSLAYCISADSHNELLLQIIVDTFNRHYVYRHDLTVDLICFTHKQLLKIKRDGLGEPMVLDYHLLLLEYLYLKMTDYQEKNMADLLLRVRETRKSCTTSFYTMKLYILDIYILIDLGHFSDATELLPYVYEFAYKREMRSSVYKLTYIKAHLMIFQNGFEACDASYGELVLALEQMIDARGNYVNDLKREAFLIVRMVQVIAANEPDRLSTLVSRQSGDNLALLETLYAYLRGEDSNQKDLFCMKSYYVFHDINFPTI